MMKKPCVYIAIVLFCLFPELCPAKSGWVSDMLLLTFRQGPGNTHQVLKTLASNTPVTILDEQNNFYQVELASKEVGWVDKKFIIFEPPRAVLLAQAQSRITTLENRIKSLETDIQSRKTDLASTQSEYANRMAPLEGALKTAKAENQKLKADLGESRKSYATLIKQSKNIQAIVAENKTLQTENATLSAQLKTLKDTNKTQFRTAMIKWFLAGVGVLLLGWVIGQSVSSRKRRYGSLLD